jgi:hypothetical protein
MRVAHHQHAPTDARPPTLDRLAVRRGSVLSGRRTDESGKLAHAVRRWTAQRHHDPRSVLRAVGARWRRLTTPAAGHARRDDDACFVGRDPTGGAAEAAMRAADGGNLASAS